MNIAHKIIQDGGHWFLYQFAFFVFQLFCFAILYVTLIWSHMNFIIWFQYTMKLHHTISTQEFNLIPPWSHVTLEDKDQVLDTLNQPGINF